MDELKLIVLPLHSKSNSFNLEKAVCNHGFFMMAPNQWIPSRKSLLRPLRIGNSPKAISVTFSISQPSNDYLLITPQHDHKIPLIVSPQDRGVICVARMLRVSAKDEKQLEEFHKIYPEAKQKGLGRIFRSPTLFEDIVKSILLCNCTWQRSLEMAQALCALQQKLSNGSMRSLKNGSKRKHSSMSGDEVLKNCSEQKKTPKKPSINIVFEGNFPSSNELARLDAETLNQHCNMGYRASTILQLARDVESGTLNLDYLEHTIDYDNLVNKLQNIKGFGPFTISNIMMCIGFYQQVPVDTETIKHVEEVYGKTNLKKNNKATVIAEIYGKYAPYQCLAYWKERIEYYETKLGKLSELPKSLYCNVSTSNIEKKAGLNSLS